MGARASKQDVAGNDPMRPYSSTISTNDRVQRRNMDDEIKALALELEETQSYYDDKNGKYKAEDRPDTNIAISVFRDEVTTCLKALCDSAFPQSIPRAVGTDVQAITYTKDQEIKVKANRCLLARTNIKDPELENPPSTDDSTELSLFDSRDLHFHVPDCCPNSDGKESGGTAGPSTRRKKELKDCCACHDNFPPEEISCLSCAHLWCNSCLKSLFLKAAEEECLFPPKCCREPIPLGLIEREMSETELDRYRSAEVEFSTSDRTYCSNVNCGKFITLANVKADRAGCSYCSTYTCIMCKSTYHEKDDCKADPALEATLELAERKGWRRCYACRAMVELTIGCFHITCPCSAEFCYLCAAPWKTCNCVGYEARR